MATHMLGHGSTAVHGTLTWARATRVEVTEVPMLAPMMSAIACLTVNKSAATIVMMIDVDVEEDCTRTVTRTLHGATRGETTLMAECV